MKTKQIEIQRTNVTVAQFFKYIEKQCIKKGISFELDIEDFKNPLYWYNDSYHIQDGIKHIYGDGNKMEIAVSDYTYESEVCKVKPYEYQICIKEINGRLYNEICEFTFDSENKGYGYYYQIDKH